MKSSNGLVGALTVGVVVAAGVAQTLPYLCSKPCPGGPITFGQQTYVIHPFNCPCDRACSYGVITDDNGNITHVYGACADLV